MFATTAESGQTVELAHNVAGGYNVTGWSPDGKWLVTTKRDADQNADVVLFEVDTKREVNVTQSPWSETQGTITPDGTKVLFISDRNDGVNQLFSVSLSRLTEDPNDPLVRERQRRAQGARGGGAGAAAGDPAAGGAAGGARAGAAGSRRSAPGAHDAERREHSQARRRADIGHHRGAVLFPLGGRPHGLLPVHRRSGPGPVFDLHRGTRPSAPRRRRVSGHDTDTRSPARLLHRRRRALADRADRPAPPHARAVHGDRARGRARGMGADSG